MYNNVFFFGYGGGGGIPFSRSSRMLLQRDLNQNKCQGNKAHGKFTIIKHILLLLYFDCSAHCSFPGQCRTLIKWEIVSQRKPLLWRFDAAPKSGDIQTLSRLLRKFGSVAFSNWMRYRIQGHISWILYLKFDLFKMWNWKVYRRQGTYFILRFWD